MAILNKARPYYDEMLRLQGGGCAICSRRPSDKRRLDMDHDHRRMVVRGLLCPRCNRAIPSWMDGDWLLRAAQYLESPPADWVNDLL